MKTKTLYIKIIALCLFAGALFFTYWIRQSAPLPPDLPAEEPQQEEFSIDGVWNYVETKEIHENGDESPFPIHEFKYFKPSLTINAETISAAFYENTFSGSLKKTGEYLYSFTDITASGEGMTESIEEVFELKYDPDTKLIRYYANGIVAHYFSKE